MTPPGDAPALEAVSLVRSFGRVRAVDGVGFRLAPGRLMALFGPNGAGKSTVLGLLAGSLRPDSGEVRIGDRRVTSGDLEARGRIGVLSHQTFLYGRLTAVENLEFYGRLYGIQDPDRRIAEGLEAVGLSDRSREQVRTYSRGMRQRLALARTLLHDPEIVLLDEPYTGLDAHATDTLNTVLVSLKDGRRTVVLVTHNLTRGLEMADQLAIQVRGRLVYESADTETDPTTFERFYREQVDGAS